MCHQILFLKQNVRVFAKKMAKYSVLPEIFPVSFIKGRIFMNSYNFAFISTRLFYNQVLSYGIHYLKKLNKLLTSVFLKI